MERLTATKRTFTDVETGSRFRLYETATGKYRLIAEGDREQHEERIANGNEVNGFYICANTIVTIRLNTKAEIYLQIGTFYNLKEGEEITHKKYLGFKKFTKV